MKKKMFCALLVFTLLFGFNMPIKALAQDSKVDNVSSMKQDIISKETVNENDIRWIKSSFGSVSISDLGDGLTMIEVSPYYPESISCRGSITEEHFTMIGLVVKEEDAGGSKIAGSLSQSLSGGSGSVIAVLTISYDRVVESGGYDCFKCTGGSVKITNFYETQLTYLTRELQTSGLYFRSATDAAAFIPGGVDDLRSSASTSYPSINVQYSVSSPSSYYWRVGAGCGYVILRAYITYTHGNGSYNTTLQLNLY